MKICMTSRLKNQSKTIGEEARGAMSSALVPLLCLLGTEMLSEAIDSAARGAWTVTDLPGILIPWGWIFWAVQTWGV
jgi:hypothetical protein